MRASEQGIRRYLMGDTKWIREKLLLELMKVTGYTVWHTWQLTALLKHISPPGRRLVLRKLTHTCNMRLNLDPCHYEWSRSQIFHEIAYCEKNAIQSEWTYNNSMYVHWGAPWHTGSRALRSQQELYIRYRRILAYARFVFCLLSAVIGKLPSALHV